MTKRDVEIQALLLRHRANGCVSALVRWENTFSNETAKGVAAPALQARIHQLEAEADGLDALVDQWDEFGPYFEDQSHDRIEGADGASYALDLDIGSAIGLKPTMTVGCELLGNRREVPVRCPSYSASIDHALSLVPEGWSVQIIRSLDGRGAVSLYRFDNGDEPTARIHSEASTPALALRAAALRARTTTQETQDG